MSKKQVTSGTKAKKTIVNIIIHIFIDLSYSLLSKSYSSSRLLSKDRTTLPLYFLKDRYSSLIFLSPASNFRTSLLRSTLFSPTLKASTPSNRESPPNRRKTAHFFFRSLRRSESAKLSDIFEPKVSVGNSLCLRTFLLTARRLQTSPLNFHAER